MKAQELKITVSIIIPVHYGGECFEQCLASIAKTEPPPDEIIIVADGDTDGVWQIANAGPATVLHLSTPGGPARARNYGGCEASGAVLFFVDADVVIPQDAVGQMKSEFSRDGEVAAVFGSYDDLPAATNFLSQYKNLFHHYVHQAASEKADTFWAGCGAVRRDVFIDVGGFDERYRRPSIEDIELGCRLKDAGWKIRLRKSLQAKHLKKWSVRSLLGADIFYRALPWTELILAREKIPADLNLKMSSRISAGCVFLFLGALAGAVFNPGMLIFAFVLALVLIGLNFDLYRFFYRKRGGRFTVMVIPWHWFYYFYGGLAFIAGFFKYRLWHAKR